MDASLELHSESVFVGTDPNQLNNQSIDASTDSIPDFSTLPPGQSRAPVYGQSQEQRFPPSGPGSITYEDDGAGEHFSESEELDEFEALERALQQEAPKPSRQQPQHHMRSTQSNGTAFERGESRQQQQPAHIQQQKNVDMSSNAPDPGPPVSKLVARVFGVGSTNPRQKQEAHGNASMQFDEQSGEISFHGQAPARQSSASSQPRPHTGSSGSSLSLQPPTAARGADDRPSQSSRRHRSSGQSRSSRAGSPSSDKHRFKRDRRHRSRGGDSRRRGRRGRDGGDASSGGEGGGNGSRHRSGSVDERPPLHGSGAPSANTSLDTSYASLGDESVDMLVTRVAAVQPELASIVHAQLRRLTAQQAEVDVAEREAEAEAAALQSQEAALAAERAQLQQKLAQLQAQETRAREQKEDFDAWAAAERAALQAHVAEEKSKAKAAVRVAQRQARAMAEGVGGSPSKGGSGAGAVVGDKTLRSEVDALKATLSKTRAEAGEREEKLRGTVSRYQGLNKQLGERLEALEAEVEHCEAARVQVWKAAEDSKARERAALQAQRAAEATVQDLRRQLQAAETQAQEQGAARRNDTHERWPRASDDILPEGGRGGRRPPPAAPAAGSGASGAADWQPGYGYFDRDDTAEQGAGSDDDAGHSADGGQYSDGGDGGGYADEEEEEEEGEEDAYSRGSDNGDGSGRHAAHAYEDERSVSGSYINGQHDGVDAGGALSDGGDPDPGATSLLSPEAALVSERELGQGKREQKFNDGSRVVSFRNGTVKEALPDGRSVIRFHNGDVKRSYPGEGLVVYFYAGAGTLHTTYASGVEVFKFPNGQTERHLANGCKEIHFSDGTVKMVLPSGEQRSTFPDGSTLVEHAAGGRTLYSADGTLLEHDAADEA